MPIDLHHRLSEFSYGYGVTREVERLLEMSGCPTVPFLPSLPHEALLGFDVAFDAPGRPLLLQFKLGEFLKRYRKRNRTVVAPSINRDFWRFRIDTSEPEGQYSILLQSQMNDAFVYYIAPKFSRWDAYAEAFQNNDILQRSFFMDPLSIEYSLRAQGATDGWHDVMYKDTLSCILSEPADLPYIRGRDVIENIKNNVLESDVPISHYLNKIYQGLSEMREIRLDRTYRPTDERQLEFSGILRSERGERASSLSREQRLERIRDITGNDALSKFIVIGQEAWAKGAQLLIVKRYQGSKIKK